MISGADLLLDFAIFLSIFSASSSRYLLKSHLADSDVSLQHKNSSFTSHTRSLYNGVIKLSRDLCAVYYLGTNS